MLKYKNRIHFITYLQVIMYRHTNIARNWQNIGISRIVFTSVIFCENTSDV